MDEIKFCSSSSVLENSLDQNVTIDSTIGPSDNLFDGRISTVSDRSCSFANLSVDELLHFSEEIADSDLMSWDFDVSTIQVKVVLRSLLFRLVDNTCRLEQIGVSRELFARFLLEVENHYNDNPFHNFFHAASVTHFACMLSNSVNAPLYLGLFYHFGLILSAIVHDIDHPGNSNTFEINSKSAKALLYNNKSVLENHHFSTAYRILDEEMFSAMIPSQYRDEVKQTIEAFVLATDMAFHFGLISEFDKQNSENFCDFEEKNDKILLGKLIIHAADLSNPVRPFHVTKKWAENIARENNAQAKREAELGLPVLSYTVTHTMNDLCKSEIHFGGAFVAPMWRSLANRFAALEHLPERLAQNIENWKSILSQLEAGETDVQFV